MKLGIIGLTGAGKATIFEALSRNFAGIENKSENRIGSVRVPEPRLAELHKFHPTSKIVYAHVDYFLPGISEKKKDQTVWTAVRDCDALIHVIRNFGGYGATPVDDFKTIDQELMFSDLVVVEKRLERLEHDKKRGKPADPEELSLLTECKKHLEKEVPLRRFPEISGSNLLKGYAFLSAKPMLVLFNNDDENESLPEAATSIVNEPMLVIRGRLEHELAQMTEEEAKEFLNEFSISESAADRVIRQSYELLGTISFFTIGDDEVRAWTIKKGTCALDAAEVIHSDMKKGFIRAEVVSYTDLIAAGSYAEARKHGTVRLEGKTYIVQDGDVITFRFNV